MKEIIRKSAGLAGLQANLNVLLSAQALDYRAISKTVTKIETIQSAMRDAYFRTLDKADNILTDEQKEQTKSMLNGMAEEPEGRK